MAPSATNDYYSSLSDPHDKFATAASTSATSAAAASPAYVKAEKLDHDDTPSRLNPLYWSTRAYIITGVVVALVIVAVVVGAVEGTKLNAYPDYSKLSYSLTDTYSGTDFFDNFDYFTASDPTDGFVIYGSETVASSMNLTYASSTSAVLRVDNTQTTAQSGRYSARVTSKTQYSTGLFVFDVVHSPYGCATWPALWLTDPSNWPTNGEIDVMEAVNQATSGNTMTLHTTEGCTMGVKRKETGTQLKTNCWNGTNDNAGCGVTGPTNTIGEAFNNVNGGVYATELRAAGIRIWFWERSAIPADITASTPDPSTWGEALADFPATDCDVSTHFKNQSIIINIDVCGSWAGETSVYTTLDACPSTCTTYAASTASAFDEAYWEFNSFKVYTAS